MSTQSPPKPKRSRPWSVTITSLTHPKHASKRNTMAPNPTNKPLATLEEIFKPMQATSWHPGDIITRMRPTVEPKSPTFVTTAPQTVPTSTPTPGSEPESKPRHSRMAKVRSMINLRRRRRERLVSVDDTARVVQLERHDSAYASRDEGSDDGKDDEKDDENVVDREYVDGYENGYDYENDYGYDDYDYEIDYGYETEEDYGIEDNYEIEDDYKNDGEDGSIEDGNVEDEKVEHEKVEHEKVDDHDNDVSGIDSQPSSIEPPRATPTEESKTPSPLLTISIPLPKSSYPRRLTPCNDSLWDEIAIPDTESKTYNLKQQDLNSARNAFRLAYETVSQLQTRNERLPSTEKSLDGVQEEKKVQLSITGENVRKLRKTRSWRTSRLRSNLELNHPFTPHYARSQILRRVLRGEEDGDCMPAAPPPQLPRSCKTCTGVCNHVITRDTLRRKKWEEQLQKRVTVCVQVESDAVGVLLEREKYQFEADDEEEWMEGVKKSLTGEGGVTDVHV